MTAFVATILRWSVIGLLVAFMARRYLFMLAALAPARRTEPDRSRSIALIIAARNESAHLARLFAALERIEYPREQLAIVLVDDASDDDSLAQMKVWSASRTHCQVVSVSSPMGKGAALAAGFAVAPPHELIAVLDADSVPEPDALARLAGAFRDPLVGAATGYPRPDNATASTVARYAALERWMHHLVTLAAKDRLGLNPSIIGVVFAVRREALVQAGGFPSGRVAEDLDLSVSLTDHGWRLRWIGDAVAREDVVESRAAFDAQRTRWTRGTLGTARQSRSLEQWFVAAGYLDRVVLVLAVFLALVGLLSVWWPIAYLAAPALGIVVAVRRAQASPVVAYLLAAATMFGTDLLVTLRATVGHIFGTSVRWGGRA
jgi:cellulose synthase/poly-beta-1,6-N-acetylglucosamine synthase-like glycosyltransferase